MSNARLCDRCGQLYKYYTIELCDELKENFKHTKNRFTLLTCNGFTLLNVGEDGLNDRVGAPNDLCPECLNELMSWFVDKKDIKELSKGAENE